MNHEPTDPFAGLATATQVATPALDMITDKQADFITKLLAERPSFATAGADVSPENIRSLTKRKASALIDDLLKLPKETTTVAPRGNGAPELRCPTGRYALVRDGVMKFYKVNSPTEGRWAGYTFVDAQASDDWWPIRNRESRDEILELIMADGTGLEALARYGREIGKCGRCGRTLTSEWRERGIGPVCNAKAW